MPFMTLNGVTVPAALNATNRRASEVIGEEARGHTGTDIGSVQTRKGVWHSKLTPQVAATARAFRALVEGEGHVWSFDSNLYSSKGLGPSLSTGCAVGAGGKYGSRVKVDGGKRLGYTISGSATDYTLLYWKKAQNGGAWEHFINRSGTIYRNGVADGSVALTSYDGSTLYLISPGYNWAADKIWIANDTPTPDDWYMDTDRLYLFQLVDAGLGTNGGTEPTWDVDPYGAITTDITDPTMQWEYQGDAAGYFDDVMFVPYVIPTAWVALLYAEANARAFTGLPSLRMAGDVVASLASGVATVRGKVGESQLIKATGVTNLEALDVELREA